MMKKVFILFWIFIAVPLAVAQITSPPGGFVSPQPRTLITPQSYGGGHGFVTPQTYQPSFQDFYTRQGLDYKTFFPTVGDFDRCEARQDFILHIPVGGCSPGVVRSDLLEEQNVPVFCQVDALKLNPLVDVSWIRSVQFTGQYPQEVSGLSWHPSRAGLRFYHTLLQSPFLNNIGYIVVVLKRQPDEKKMPEKVRLNVTARIAYDLEKAFGTGRVEFTLPVVDEGEWERNYQAYSFWKGKAFARVDSIQDNRATVSIYRDKERKLASFVLEKGKTSPDIYLPGFYCRAGIQVRFDGAETPDIRAKIAIDDSEFFLKTGERFLNDRCRVVSVSPLRQGGRVVVNCVGKNIPLSLAIANAVQLVKGGEAVFVNVGGYVRSGAENIYLLGIGETPKTLSLGEGEERRFIVLGKNVNTLSGFTGDDGNINPDKVAAISSAITGTTSAKDLNEYRSIIGQRVGGMLKDGSKNAEVKVVFFKEEGFGYGFDLAGSADRDYGNQGEEGILVEEYFQEALKSAQDIASSYAQEKIDVKAYGEEALLRAAELAGVLGKQKTQAELFERIVKDYPDSSTARYAEAQLRTLRQYNYKNAVSFVDLQNELHTIQLLDIKEPEFSALSATFFIKNEQKRLGVNDDYSFSGNESILVKQIARETVTVTYSSVDREGRQQTRDITLRMNQREQIGSTFIELREITFEQEARIAILPKLPHQYSEANVTVQIGIEKRAIKLSDEKTLEMIENLNKSIERFDKIVANLGKTIKVMKGACFATMGVLLVKNFVAGLGGGVQARQAVMQKWYTHCTQISGGDRVKFNECLRTKNAEIQSDIAAYKTNVESVNSNLKMIQEANKNELGGVDVGKTTNAYREYMKKYVGQSFEIEKDGKKVPVKLTQEMVNSASITELRDLELAIKNGGSNSGFVQELGLGERGKILPVLQTREENAQATAQQNTIFGDKALVDRDVPLETVLVRPYYGQKVSDLGYTFPAEDNVKADAPVQALTVGSKYYVAVLNREGNNDRYGGTAWYNLNVDADGMRSLTKVTNETELAKLRTVSFQLQDERTLTNPWADAKKVSFHETGSFKGLPAIIPLGEKWGRQKGWYVATKNYNIFSEVNTPRAFTEAALPKNYYICNVGKNRVQEFETSLSDDHCQFINVDAGAPDRILGLSQGDSRELYQVSQQAVYQAASQYAQSGGAGGRIKVLDGEFEVGPPPVLGGAKCQDFMSPQDCQLLFNLCDPVLCPASRCDLGGAYPVADVVQSGIIGSTVLCLPNFREGVFIPVCLSGIQAGLDGYVQILKLTRGCLEESLATGKTIGICDEIKSLYLCEYFWRQIAPMTKLLLPKLIEVATGQGTRGGSEYLTVRQSFDQLDKSVDYLKNDYALNAYKAFQKRSTDDVGTEICKGFISARYPSDKKFLDNLLEPDSPYQFYATFDEIKFTEATVPATSQYKVYYAIYAGKDEGIYYSVYLTNPPETGYYAQQPFLFVSTGFVPRGKSLDEAKDFTAPAGYKELCVRINGKDECGFKSVTTSFASNYLKEKYLVDQANNEVASENECVSGSPSALAFAQPNVQEGADQFLNPSLYKRGIIRVCATDNPGKSVDPKVGSQEARWRPVGYCSADKRIKCWLDSESIEDNIRNKNLQKEALEDVKDLAAKINNTEIYDEGQTNDALAILRKKYRELNVDHLLASGDVKRVSAADVFRKSEVGKFAGEAEDLELKGFINKQKAEALFLKYQVFDIVAKKLFEKIQPKLLSPTQRPSQVNETKNQTTTSVQTIAEQVRSISFRVDGKVTFTAKTDDTIEVGVDHTCGILEYEVKSQQRLFRIDFLSPDGKVLAETLYEEDSFELSRLEEGKYYVEAQCQGKPGTKLKSAVLTVSGEGDAGDGGITSIAFFLNNKATATATTTDAVSLRVEHRCDQVNVVLGTFAHLRGNYTLRNSEKTVELGKLGVGTYTATAICLNVGGRLINTKKATLQVVVSSEDVE